MANSDGSGMRNNLLLIAVVMLAFVSGSLWSKVKMLEKGTTTTTTAQGTTQQPDAAGQVAGATNPGQPQPGAELKIVKPDASKDHWRGEKDARLVMVEFSDYQCPFCSTFKPTAERILDENKGKVALVYRNFPLSFHEKAQKSAEAAECVADIGGNDAYWKMHDKIFAAMPAMELSQLPDLASQVGLSKEKVKECIDSGKFANKVKDDLAAGSTAGVAATPTTVVYDMKTGKTKTIEGALPYESVKTTIDEMLKG